MVGLGLLLLLSSPLILLMLLTFDSSPTHGTVAAAAACTLPIRTLSVIPAGVLLPQRSNVMPADGAMSLLSKEDEGLLDDDDEEEPSFAEDDETFGESGLLLDSFI